MPTQRDLVEVPVYLPHDVVEQHPAIIISNQAYHELENQFYAVMCSTEIEPEEFALELTADMINGRPMRETTYVKTHLVQSFPMDTRLQLRGSVTIAAFRRIKEKIVHSIFEAG